MTQEGREPAERPKRPRTWRRLWAALQPRLVTLRPWLKRVFLAAQLGLFIARLAHLIRSCLL